MNKFLNAIHSDNRPVRIVKRGSIPWWKTGLLYLLSLVFALAMGGIFILAIGKSPMSFYAKMFTGAFSNAIYIKLLLRSFVPLLVTSIGISVAFKMKYWNIGAEGQFLIGSLCAASAAFLLGNSLPSWLTIIIILVAGAVGGGIYGVITALFKVKWGTNETLLTLMFNYIALYIIKYLVYVPFYKAPGNGIPTFKPIPEIGWLTTFKMGDVMVDTGFIIAIALVFIVFVYFRFSKHGYELTVVGDSPNTAKYAGINVKKVIVRTMFLSSLIVGLAGAMQLTGSAAGHSLSSGLTSGVGWTGIIVAWLAKLNPIGIGVVAFLMAVLENGCEVARAAMHISAAVADILQGIILFSVLGFDFFIKFKLVFRKIEKKNSDTHISKGQDDGLDTEDSKEISSAVVLDSQAQIVEKANEGVTAL